MTKTIVTNATTRSQAPAWERTACEAPASRASRDDVAKRVAHSGGWSLGTRGKRRWRSLLVVVSLSLAAMGCGNDLPRTVPVRGQITFDGGPCPKEGVINFSPIEPAPGMPRRPGSAHFGTDGKFVATSFSQGEGLVPGRYSVRIDCWKRPPLGDGNPPISYVEAAYIPPELEVTASSGAIEFNLDVPAAQ